MSVGIIKEVDKLGRIVIPKEMRERYLIDARVEILMTEDGILIKSPDIMFVRIQENEKEHSSHDFQFFCLQRRGTDFVYRFRKRIFA